jgi:hypothetical protein
MAEAESLPLEFIQHYLLVVLVVVEAVWDNRNR